MSLHRLALFCFLLACLGTALAALASGADWLEEPLVGRLPLGNLLAAVIPVAPALMAWLVGRAGTWQRRGTATALVAAVAWLPVSIALAGNLALDFPGDRGTVWLGFSAVVMLAVLGVLAWGVVGRLRQAWHRRH